MISRLTNWIRGYATWAAILILSAATLSALIANGVVFPLVLVCLAVGLVIFRNWDAIKAFDLWAFDEWARAVTASIRIHEWHASNHAAELFCDPTIVKARNEAAAKMNYIMMNLIKEPSHIVGAPIEAGPLKVLEQERATPGRHADHDAAQAEYEKNNLALSHDLLRQLIAGNLIAKGLLDTMQSKHITQDPR